VDNAATAENEEHRRKIHDYKHNTISPNNKSNREHVASFDTRPRNGVVLVYSGKTAAMVKLRQRVMKTNQIQLEWV